MLDNFILIYYEKDKLNHFELKRHEKYNPNLPIDFRLKIHKNLINLCIKRIKDLYPKATIHLITDKKRNWTNVIEHVFDNMNDHTAKFAMYGLLNDPAMYIDSDVLLVKPFSKKHLDIDSPINPYDFNHINTFIWNGEVYNHYHSGVVYVKNPSQAMQKEIEYLYNVAFKDTDILDGKSINDEYAMSMFISKRKLNITIFPGEVNVMYHERFNDLKEMMKCQSIHYVGPKHLFEPHMKKIRERNIWL